MGQRVIELNIMKFFKYSLDLLGNMGHHFGKMFKSVIEAECAVVNSAVSILIQYLMDRFGYL